MSKSRIPKTAKKLPHRTLREGKHTGHAHRAVATNVGLYDVGDGVLFARVPTGSPIVHEEHNTIHLPPGEMAVGGVREFDHFAEEAREVMD